MNSVGKCRRECISKMDLRTGCDFVDWSHTVQPVALSCEGSGELLVNLVNRTNLVHKFS